MHVYYNIILYMYLLITHNPISPSDYRSPTHIPQLTICQPLEPRLFHFCGKHAIHMPLQLLYQHMASLFPVSRDDLYIYTNRTLQYEVILCSKNFTTCSIVILQLPVLQSFQLGLENHAGRPEWPGSPVVPSQQLYVGDLEAQTVHMIACTYNCHGCVLLPV